MNRFSALLPRLSLMILCLTSFDAALATAPNIIIVVVDDLGYGDLSSYGATDLQSPHLDKFFSEGMRFTEFYANCPVCSPTRAAILTGKYQDLVGVPGVIRTHADNSWGNLVDHAVLLPTVLKQAGYNTACIGKWHLGLEAPDRPNDRGFDLFHGFLGDMMDDYYHHRRHEQNYMRLNDETIDPDGHATDLFTTWACNYIDEQSKQDSPFFLYLAYNAPHTPIQPREDWLKRVQAREPNIDESRAKLVALIEHLDDGIGQVLSRLDEAGEAENTLIFFTSDNGGQLNVGANNGPLRDGKQSVYEGGIKIPAGVRWVGQIPPGTVSDFRVLTMDIFPTACEAAGIEVEKSWNLDAASFLPTCLGNDQSELRDLWFFRRREGGNRYGGKTIEAVRRGNWKLLQNSPFEPLELYNLENDSQEQNNLAEKAPRIFNELSAALRQEIQRYGTVPWQ
ncbi:sulfatase-like hydrolase/transferase [Thalassoglobus sp. JC818]|uniref:sulfatase-like hydrolase/transferase n=1 Tax=Thalassoglobus sp. JC818 TaxID=3232136 RepID=UPI0034579E2E